MNTDDDGDDESSASLDTSPAHLVKSDSDIERVINYRLAVNPDVLAGSIITNPRSKSLGSPPAGPFDAKWWHRRTSAWYWEQRKPFLPCNHEGNCIEANCRCYREGVPCEKSCRCLTSCNRRFPGCKCEFVSGKRVCRQSQTSCLCVKFKRECDPDLCGACGAPEILDPVNRYNTYLLRDRCSNVDIQRGVPKKTLLGQSQVHGFGLYTGEDIAKDEMIGEYTGEVISKEESGRRDVIYLHEQTMYLFKLNKGILV